MKGVFEERPSLPRASKHITWDPKQVLSVLETWVPNNSLTLKELTYKLVMLLALLTGQRCQTIHKLQIDSMKMADEKCTFMIDSLLKHSRAGNHLKPIELTHFPPNKSVCVIEVLKEYLSRTREHRVQNKTSQLLLSFHSPFKPVSKDTIARWIKAVLELSGIDTSVYTAHSTRAASTSAASRTGLPICDIMKAAGWSREDTFAKYYKKQTTCNFGQALLTAYWKDK